MKPTQLSVFITIIVLLFTLKPETKGMFFEKQSTTDPLLTKVLTQLKLSESNVAIDFYCKKVLPNDKSLSVLVIPKISESSSDEEKIYDAYIVLVDNATGTIKSKYFQGEAWSSNDMTTTLSSIEIDTAPYLVTSTIRGFGIRINYGSKSGANPSGKTDFSLFIRNGEELKSILKDYIVYEHYGEWDTVCEGTFDTKSSTIVIDKSTISNAFYNIIIKQISRKYKQVRNGDACIEKTISKKLNTFVLKYNANEEYE